MRKFITRKMATSIIYGKRVILVNDDAKAEDLPPVVVGGIANINTATKELRKAYPDDELITVSKIETNEDVYRISVEDFLKHAERVEQETKEENVENEEN